MIDRIEVRNFQSLKKVDLDLGPFTVIVGPSSSGKSALVRALKAVASNMRGAGSITQGAKQAAITVRTADAAVTLERTATAGAYRVVDLASADGYERTYTKLAGGVPEAVTKALRIAPVPAGGTSIHFAGQFDRPYLLDASGAVVARELGELTNVTTIFQAVREGNRIRNAHQSTLKTREADLEALKARAAQFSGLPAKLAACDAAERAAEKAALLADKVSRLSAAIDALDVAEGVLRRAADLPEVPDTARLDEAQRRLFDFRGLVEQWVSAARTSAALGHQIARHTEELAALDRQLSDTLIAAGTCPTCGQPVTPAR